MTRSNTVSDGYKEAGVDIAEADEGLANIVAPHHRHLAAIRASARCSCRSAISPTSIDLGGIGLAIGTDGVGSKAIIAEMMRKYDTIGIDCVAMNVNDLLCVGARPLSLVDYIAVEKADAAMLDGDRDRPDRRGAASRRFDHRRRDFAARRCRARLRPGRHRGRDGAARPHPGRPRSGAGRPRSSASPAAGMHSNGFTLTRRVFFDIAKRRGRPRISRNSAARSARSCCARPIIYVPEILELLECDRARSRR